MKALRKPVIGVIGAGSSEEKLTQLAQEVGLLIAQNGAILVCGGLGGVMEAACRGAKEAGGVTVGIIPSDDKSKANDFVDIVIPSGIGQARNLIIINSADCLIALPGRYGTLSEMAFALKTGKPLVSLSQWKIDDNVIQVESPAEAVEKAMELIRK